MRVSGSLFVMAAAVATCPVAFAQYAGNDPCPSMAKSVVAISQTASARLVLAKTGKIAYICSLSVTPADAENISLVEGTGSVCGSNTAAIIGSTSAANGPNLAAKTPLTIGNGGATVASGLHTAYDVCLLQSGTGVVAGAMTYVQK